MTIQLLVEYMWEYECEGWVRCLMKVKFLILILDLNSMAFSLFILKMSEWKKIHFSIIKKSESISDFTLFSQEKRVKLCM